MTINRKEVYKEMEEMFGLVPSFFKLVPDSTLKHEWELFKAVQLNETAIPNKYKELIGVAISAAVRCRYCSLFHTEMAKLNGATDAEIEEAVHFAKSSAGWSTYVNGLQIDYEQFKSEVQRACEYVRSMQGAMKELRCRDVGADCDYVIRGKTDKEIFKKAAEHVKTVHHMKEIPKDLLEKARAAIHSAA